MCQLLLLDDEVLILEVAEELPHPHLAGCCPRWSLADQAEAASGRAFALLSDEDGDLVDIRSVP